MPEPEDSPLRRRRGSARRRREDQIVDAMMRLRRCHPHVFDAMVVIIAHADARTLDAVAELMDFALRVGAGDLAPSTLHEHAKAHAEAHALPSERT
jgi:hypothetical protein